LQALEAQHQELTLAEEQAKEDLPAEGHNSLAEIYVRHQRLDGLGGPGRALMASVGWGLIRGRRKETGLTIEKELAVARNLSKNIYGIEVFTVCRCPELFQKIFLYKN
jgi:hypothetical protein